MCKPNWLSFNRDRCWCNLNIQNSCTLLFVCFLSHSGICGSFSRAFPEKKNKCLLSKHRCDLKSHIENQIPCRYRVTIYVNFPHYISLSLTHGSLCTQGGAGGTPWGPGRFRWKLHPSSEAWPPISTSNRGETAIAKCPNCPCGIEYHKSSHGWLGGYLITGNHMAIIHGISWEIL